MHTSFNTLTSYLRKKAKDAGLSNPVNDFKRSQHIKARKPREVSAMLRIKNEEDYLYAAVQSIAECVEEIIIIDNLSTDSTPTIIEALCKKYPGKIFHYKYCYAVGKMGKENWELMKSPFSRFSPHLLANYYNWCLRKCRKPYVLKWDGDMIATEAFARSIQQFKESKMELLYIKGANIHPDLKHLVAPDLSDDQSSIELNSFDNYLYPFTAVEPRLFPKAFARYTVGLWYCEQFQSPFLCPGYNHEIEDICYLHMKYCKSDPWLNFSDEFKSVVSSSIRQGIPLDSELTESLRKWL